LNHDTVHFTVQKEQHLRLLSLIQRESILYVTDTISIASSLVDFYAFLRLHRWYTLLVAEVTFQHIP
jgi:hypothetical protein